MELRCPACEKTARLSGIGEKGPIDGCWVFECDKCRQGIVVSVLAALSDRGTWSLAAREVSGRLLRLALREALVSVLPTLDIAGVRRSQESDQHGEEVAPGLPEPETVTVRKDTFEWLIREVVASARKREVEKKFQASNPPDLSYDRVPFDQISERGVGNYYVFKKPYDKSFPIVYVPIADLDVIYGQGRMSGNSTIEVSIRRDS